MSPAFEAATPSPSSSASALKAPSSPSPFSLSCDDESCSFVWAASSFGSSPIARCARTTSRSRVWHSCKTSSMKESYMTTWWGSAPDPL